MLANLFQLFIRVCQGRGLHGEVVRHPQIAKILQVGHINICAALVKEDGGAHQVNQVQLSAQLSLHLITLMCCPETPLELTHQKAQPCMCLFCPLYFPINVVLVDTYQLHYHPSPP